MSVMHLWCLKHDSLFFGQYLHMHKDKIDQFGIKIMIAA